MDIGAPVPQNGLSFFGQVTQVIDPLNFIVTGENISGQRNDFFQNWTVYVASQVKGTGAAPQNQGVECVASVGLTGQIALRAPFGTPLSVGDQVLLIQEYIASNTVQTVFPSDNVKESFPGPVSTRAIGYTKVAELAFTGIQGGARIKFELKVDNPAGTASAAIGINNVGLVNPVIYTDSTGAYQPFSQDIFGLKAGDLIQIYAKVNAATRIASVRNFTIGYDTVTFPSVGLTIDKVYIDAVNGAAGIQWPLGTPGYPVNNLTDAKNIAAYRNTNNFHVKNGLVLDQPVIAYNFFGDGDVFESYIDLNNQDVSASSFFDLGVIGSSPGLFFGTRCFVSGEFGVTFAPAVIFAQLTDCGVGSIQPVPLLTIDCLNCKSYGGAFSFSTAGGGFIGWEGGLGFVALINSDNALSTFVMNSTQCALYLDPTCTNGVVVIDEAYSVNDFSSPGCQVSDYASYQIGKPYEFSLEITSPANAGDVLVATVVAPPNTVIVTSKPRIKINSVLVRSRGNTTADLTSAGVYAGAAKVLTLVDPALATKANLAALDAQEQGVGPWVLDVGGTVVISLVGTGATPVDLTVTIDYQPLNQGFLLK